MSASALTTSSPPRVVSSGERRQRRPWLLVLSVLLMAAAAFRSLRVELGGFLIPLHLVPILLAAPVALPALKRLPAGFRQALAAFLALFAISVLQYGSEFGDLVKMMASAVTLVTVALLVRSKNDFVAGALALAVAELVINLKGLQGGFVEYIGYQPLRDIGNKNAYSMYALPAVLISAFSLLHLKQSFTARLLHVACIVSSTFMLFTGANRAGWAGIVVIASMLAAQARQWRVLAAVVLLGAAAYGSMTWLGSTQAFDHRVEQTREGYSSDSLRESLFLTALEIGLENPLLGVGVQMLPRELAKRTTFGGEGVDPHNFIAYIAGGCGFLVLFALGAAGFKLWQRPKRLLTPNVLMAHDLVRMTLALLFLRGLFSREIFFVGSSPIALGLALGLCLLDDPEKWS